LPIYYDAKKAQVLIDPSDADIVYVLDKYLSKSTDGGSVWKGLPAHDILDELAKVAIHPNQPKHLFICGTDSASPNYTPFMAFERSLDGGAHWLYFPITTARSSASSLAVDPGNEDVIFVGGEKGGIGALFVSLDGGATWTEIDHGDFGGDPVAVIGIDPESNSRVYVGTAGGFFRTESRGFVWTKTASFPVKAIAVAATNPNEIFAIGGERIYRSGNRGRTWEDITADLAAYKPYTLHFSDADKSLYVGTAGAGINRRAIVLPARSYPPLNFSARRVLNRSLSQVEYINELTWKPDPRNSGIVSYRIYAVAGETWSSKLAEVPAGTWIYWDRKISAYKNYAYAIVAIDGSGREGEPAYTTAK
jgi:hypothetical protein